LGPELYLASARGFVLLVLAGEQRAGRLCLHERLPIVHTSLLGGLI
jgi:hypothetical protein